MYDEYLAARLPAVQRLAGAPGRADARRPADRAARPAAAGAAGRPGRRSAAGSPRSSPSASSPRPLAALMLWTAVRRFAMPVVPARPWWACWRRGAAGRVRVAGLPGDRRRALRHGRGRRPDRADAARRPRRARPVPRGPALALDQVRPGGGALAAVALWRLLRDGRRRPAAAVAAALAAGAVGVRRHPRDRVRGSDRRTPPGRTSSTASSPSWGTIPTTSDAAAAWWACWWTGTSASRPGSPCGCCWSRRSRRCSPGARAARRRCCCRWPPAGSWRRSWR